MRIWLVTDTHFGHKMMLESCGRPVDFADLIYKRWMFAVAADDVVIHLGDVCWGQDEYWHQSYIKTLPGRKWLVKGNHDNKSSAWYLAHGWDWAGYHMRDKFFGKKVLFSHIPQTDHGEWDLNIHGHFHNNTHRSQEPEMQAIYTSRHKLLALEYTDYRPVLLETFMRDNPVAETVTVPDTQGYR